MRQDALIRNVIELAPAGYKWRGPRTMHHLYWASENYKQPNLFNDRMDVMRRFRELPVHKVMLPSEFHNFLHEVTTQVETPSSDVMRRRIAGWVLSAPLLRIISSLEDSIDLWHGRKEDVEANPDRLPERYNGIDIACKEWYSDTLSRHFRGLEHHHGSGPIEYFDESDLFVDLSVVNSIRLRQEDIQPDPDIVFELARRIAPNPTWPLALARGAMISSTLLERAA